MTANRVIRASDQDRDSAAELLSEAYAVGRLTRVRRAIFRGTYRAPRRLRRLSSQLKSNCSDSLSFSVRLSTFVSRSA